MTETDTENRERRTGSIVPPIALAVLAAVAVYVSADYGVTARRLPVLIGTLVFALALLDLVSRLPGPPGHVLRLTLGAGFDEPELDIKARPRAELLQLVWIPAVVLAIAAVGILITIPVFVFFYSRLNGHWPAWLCALTAVAVTVLVGIVFEFLLDYELYRGLLFSGVAGR